MRLFNSSSAPTSAHDGKLSPSFNKQLSCTTWLKPDKVQRETKHNCPKVTWPIQGREQLDFFPLNNISLTGLHSSDCPKTDGFRQCLATTGLLLFYSGIQLCNMQGQKSQMSNPRKEMPFRLSETLGTAAQGVLQPMCDTSF